MKIPLVDNDGTLLLPWHPVYKEALVYGLIQCFGLRLDVDTIINPSYAGMIDNQILVQILTDNGFDRDESIEALPDLTETIGNYFQKNHEKVHVSNGDHFRLPGALGLLKSLSKTQHVGILTGNIKKISDCRLEKAGILKYVTEGAYGDMALTRAELVPVAKKRFSIKLKRNVKFQEFVIIGDTVKDILCARENNIQVVAISTGGSTKEELASANPDLLIESFEKDYQKVIDFLR